MITTFNTGRRYQCDINDSWLVDTTKCVKTTLEFDKQEEYHTIGHRQWQHHYFNTSIFCRPE